MKKIMFAAMAALVLVACGAPAAEEKKAEENNATETTTTQETEKPATEGNVVVDENPECAATKAAVEKAN